MSTANSGGHGSGRFWVALHSKSSASVTFLQVAVDVHHVSPLPAHQKSSDSLSCSSSHSLHKTGNMGLLVLFTALVLNLWSGTAGNPQALRSGPLGLKG